MYDPTSRVLTVLELLQSRPGISGPELARRMEVDVRSVRRYIAKLKDAGIPVEAIPGRRGGYRLRPGSLLPPIAFHPDEAASIVLSLIGGFGTSRELPRATVEKALSKLARVMPGETRERLKSIPAHLHFISARRKAPPAAHVVDLIEAADTKRRVELCYTSRDGKPTERVVEPYGLAEKDGRWYLVAHCRLRSERRLFRLDRIDRLRVLDETFVPDEGFDYRAFAEAGLEQPARWRIAVEFYADPAEAARRIPAYLGPLVETPKGVRLECPADDLDETARYLVMVGLPFAVVDPPELRDALRRLAREIARAARAQPVAGPLRGEPARVRRAPDLEA